jgi:hypothetical protein
MAIKFNLEDKPNHPIVRALLKHEPELWKPTDQIVYSPHFDSTCGWSIEGYFLGFTKDEAVDSISKNKMKLLK